jgi:hypothetical protein
MLDTTKLSTALGHLLPDVYAGLERFTQLHKEGYPQMLRSLWGE